MLLLVGTISLFGSIIVDFSLPMFIGSIINCLSRMGPNGERDIDWHGVKVYIAWLIVTIVISAITGGTRGYSFNTMS